MKDPYRPGVAIAGLDNVLLCDGLFHFLNTPFKSNYYFDSEAEWYIASALYHQRRELLKNYPLLVFLIDYARSPFIPVLPTNQIVELAMTCRVPRDRLALLRTVIRRDMEFCLYRAQLHLESDY